MKLRKFISEQQELDKIEIRLRDPDDQLLNLLKHLQVSANVGHSFNVIVDPDNKEHRGEFGIDGDGMFYLKSIKKVEK